MTTQAIQTQPVPPACQPVPPACRSGHAGAATRSLSRAIALILLFVLGSLFGCATSSPSSDDRGHLVIVGGGLKDEHAAVFNRFVSLCADGPIGIIPIASGDGVKAGESSAERWRKYSGTRPVIVIPLTQNDAAKSDDPEIAKQIASCGGLWFTGGQQDRVVNVLRPGGKRGACLAACFSVLNNKRGVIGGTSAGAAIMSDPMITGGRSLSAKSRDPDNEDNHRVTTSAGLGFFTFGLTDQHFTQRGRQGRLVDALHDTKIARGFGVSENCALVVDRATAECEVIGDKAAVWMIDASAPDAFTGEKATVRVSVLSSGDHAAARTGIVTPDQTLRDIRKPGPSGILGPAADVWAFAELAPRLRSLCEGIDGESTLCDSLTLLSFKADARSRVLQSSTNRFPCFVALRMTIEPSPQTGQK